MCGKIEWMDGTALAKRGCRIDSLTKAATVDRPRYDWMLTSVKFVLFHRATDVKIELNDAKIAMN
jgi:hypothetical protein